VSRLSIGEAIQRVVNLVSVTGDTDLVVSTIVSASRLMMAADEAYLLLREGNHLVLRAADGLPQELIGDSLFRLGEGIEGWVADHGDAVALSDARRERRFRDIRGRENRIHALAVVPMKLRDDVVGVLATAGVTPFPPAGSRLTGMEILASIAAVTLENERLLAQERRRLHQAELLLQLAAVERLEILPFLQRVASAANAALSADDTVLALREERGREVICTSGSPGSAEAARRRDGAARGLLDTTWAQRVITTGEPLLCDDVSVEPELRTDPAIFGRHCLVAVPVQMRGKRRGILMVASARPRTFGAEDVAFLTLIAAQAGLSAERSELARRQIEVSREQARQQARHEFLGLVSHELKTPVAVLKAYIELLLRKAELDPSRASDEDVLGRMLEQTDRMLAMIEQLLDLQKLETGQLSLELSRFDLAELAKRVTENLQLAASSHTLRVETEGSLPVMADRRRLEEVLFNLTENAVKYSQPGTEVCITVSKRTSPGTGAQDAVVTVLDQGSGIPERDLPKVFDRFYQGKSGFHHGHVGLGLGLYISKEIVERHGGQISVESTEGKGSAFTFTLPLTDEGPVTSDE
jgi:signal transduction histidine kinase